MTDTYNENTILGYVEGELSPEDQHAFKLTMLKDAKLRKLVEQLVADRAALRRMPLEPVPIALAEQVDQYLERNMLLGPAPADVQMRVQAERRFQLFRTSAMTAIAAVLMLGVGLFVWQTWTEMRQFTQMDLAMQGPAAAPEPDFEVPADAPAEPILDSALAMAGANMKDVSEERLARKMGRTPPPPAVAFERNAADAMPMPKEPAMDDWVDRQLLPEIGAALDAVSRDYESPIESLAQTPLVLPKTDLAPVGVGRGASDPLVIDEFEDLDQFVQAERKPELPVSVDTDIGQMREDIAVVDDPVADAELADDTQQPLLAQSATTASQLAGDASGGATRALGKSMVQAPLSPEPTRARSAEVAADGPGDAADMGKQYKGARRLPKGFAANQPLRAGEQPTEVRLTILTRDVGRSRQALTDWARQHRATVRPGVRTPKAKTERQADSVGEGPGQLRPTQASPELVSRLTLYINAGQLRKLLSDSKRQGGQKAHLALVPVLSPPKEDSPTPGPAGREAPKGAPHLKSDQPEADAPEDVTLVNPIDLVRTDSKRMKVIVTIVPRRP